jgi:hypothetical protein
VPDDVPNRAAVVKQLESWVKTEIPDMTDREAIMEAVDLRMQAGKDFRPMFLPPRTEKRHLDELAKQHPGRVYNEKSGRIFLIVKPGEKAELAEKGIQISGPADPKPTAPEMAM